MSDQGHDTISSREREILQLIADGLSNHQIAERLSISLNTIKWYLKGIYTRRVKKPHPGYIEPLKRPHDKSRG